MRYQLDFWEILGTRRYFLCRTELVERNQVLAAIEAVLRSQVFENTKVSVVITPESHIVTTETTHRGVSPTN